MGGGGELYDTTTMAVKGGGAGSTESCQTTQS